jgi:hypothetical protein
MKKVIYRMVAVPLMVVFITSAIVSAVGALIMMACEKLDSMASDALADDDAV